MPLSAAARRAIAQAEEEGLELQRGTRRDNTSGFLGVRKSTAVQSRPYGAQRKRDGKREHLGYFTTAEEAALAYARALGPEGCAAAAAARAEVSMTAEEAQRLAAAEGLVLVRSSSNAMGFVGVFNHRPGRPKPYQARQRRDGKMQHLGYFATVEEAALAVARALGPEACAAAAATRADVPMTAEEALGKAEAEGLVLERSDNATGFVGVFKKLPGQGKPYEARRKRDGKCQNLGCFATAEEAALAVARFRATGVPNVASASKRRRPRPDPRRAAALDNWRELLNAVAASDAAGPPPKKPRQQADEPPAAPTTTDAAVQVGGAAETLMQKAARIKVQLGIGPEGTTAIAILRAANEAMGLTPDCLTLPQQASRLLAEIGI